MKLLKSCIVIFIVFVGLELSAPYLARYVPQLVHTVNNQVNLNEENDDIDTEVIENDVVSVIASESRLKTLLTYLPFLGIQISDVMVNDVPRIPSKEALTFTYNSNLFALYQVDMTNEEVSVVVETLRDTNIIEFEDKSYVGYVASDLIVLIEEVNDLSSLIESVREVNGVLTSLGFEKVSLKFE